jgi:thiazole synthase ThiGH ThiG subunit
VNRKEELIRSGEFARLGAEGMRRNSAIRRAEDPVSRERAAEIIRAAIQGGLLTQADLQGPIIKGTDR